MIRNKNVIIVFAAATMIALSGWMLAGAADDDVIIACINQRSGLVRIVASETACRRGETPLSWNKQGPTGPKGDPGDPSWDEGRVAALEAHVADLEKRVEALEAPETCHAASSELLSVVADDFNAYADGSVVGQGGWINRVNGDNFVVQGAITQEGAKALHNSAAADSVITKTGTARADGRQAVCVRTDNRSGWSLYEDGNAQMRISKGSWDNEPMAAVSFKKDGHVAYHDPILDDYVDFATYNDGEWVFVEIEWRSSDRTAHYRVNGGAWTDWKPFRGAASFTDFDTVGFDFIAGGTGGVYFDALQ